VHRRWCKPLPQVFSHFSFFWLLDVDVRHLMARCQSLRVCQYDFMPIPWSLLVQPTLFCSMLWG
jgi:hypothetical protein